MSETQSTDSETAVNEQQFYIVDVRPEWRRQKYVTFWRANNSNYAWPLVWAGKYSKSTVDEHASYYCCGNGGRALVRFPVPCEVVDSMAMSDPDKGDIDGNVGPVLRNTDKVRRRLRCFAYIPPKLENRATCM